MAITRLLNPIHFQGISSDEKPDNPADVVPRRVPEGSTFHAVDTGEQWIYFDGAWERDLRLITAIQVATS